MERYRIYDANVRWGYRSVVHLILGGGIGYAVGEYAAGMGAEGAFCMVMAAALLDAASYLKMHFFGPCPECGAQALSITARKKKDVPLLKHKHIPYIAHCRSCGVEIPTDMAERMVQIFPQRGFIRLSDDDDEAEVFKGSEDGAAGAYDDSCFAAADSSVLVGSASH